MSAKEDLEADLAELAGTSVTLPSGASYRENLALRVLRRTEEAIEARTSGAFLPAAEADMTEADRAVLRLRADQAGESVVSSVEAVLAETEASEVVADSTENAEIVMSRLDSIGGAPRASIGTPRRPGRPSGPLPPRPARRRQ